MSLYQAIAEHVAEDADPPIDAEAFAAFLSTIDQGTDADWTRIDDAIDNMVSRFRRIKREEDGPSDEEIYNRYGVEGGIVYDASDNRTEDDV